MKTQLMLHTMPVVVVQKKTQRDTERNVPIWRLRTEKKKYTHNNDKISCNSISKCNDILKGIVFSTKNFEIILWF